MGYAVPGVRLGVAQAGIKKPGKDDLLVIELSEKTQTAAVFTQNAFCAAPVTVAREHLETNGGRPRYLIVNTGNANAGTGEAGLADARSCCVALGSQVGIADNAVLPFSTGVIGETLPIERIELAIPAALDALQADGWEAAAGAILTTDTRPKLRTTTFEIDGQQCVITGITKGAGMICPNLATMLAFIATDVEIAPPLLDDLLRGAVMKSFNRITVDGDTSTNDAVTLSATAESGVVIERGSGQADRFLEALEHLMVGLAQDIVRDGEGATKFVEIQVVGGESEAACDQVARTIAHSPLVKTALFAADPNWGRILAAIGRAGLEGLDTEAVSIEINGVLIAERGARAASYTEAMGQAAMSEDQLRVCVSLQRGAAESVLWTTDLSYDYVKINAEYRT